MMPTIAKNMKRPPTKQTDVKARTKTAVKTVAKAKAKAKPPVKASAKVKNKDKDTVKAKAGPMRPAPAHGYRLDEQIGFRLRRAHQRATVIFNDLMADFDVTPTQFAALAKLEELGFVSQNQLGRLTAMDPATILGVVGRLVRQGLVRTRPDPLDARLMMLELTVDGLVTIARMREGATRVSARTLSPLKPDEANLLVRLLAKIG